MGSRSLGPLLLTSHLVLLKHQQQLHGSLNWTEALMAGQANSFLTAVIKVSLHKRDLVKPSSPTHSPDAWTSQGGEKRWSTPGMFGEHMEVSRKGDGVSQGTVRCHAPEPSSFVLQSSLCRPPAGEPGVATQPLCASVSSSVGGVVHGPHFRGW